MSKQLAKEVDKLEKATQEKKETEVYQIYRRYGFKSEELLEHGSEYEKNTVLEYIYPKAIETFMVSLEVFGPTVFEVAFEHFIYPAVLRGSLKEENEDVVLGIDHAYLQLVKPELWKEFMTELKTMKTRISWELKLKFDAARRERDKLKNKIRQKIRREEQEDQELLKKEGVTIACTKKCAMFPKVAGTRRK